MTWKRPAPAVGPLKIGSGDEVDALVGQSLGQSSAITVTQDTVDRFAELTDDHQWIHVDVSRASRGPFRGTVAHGYLTLALLPRMAREIVDFHGFDAVINYGLDRVRFPNPLRVGTGVRLNADLVSAERTPRGVRIIVSYIMRTADSDAVVCAADGVTLLIGETRAG